jgi:hypothetical protein
MNRMRASLPFAVLGFVLTVSATTLLLLRHAILKTTGLRVSPTLYDAIVQLSFFILAVAIIAIAADRRLRATIGMLIGSVIALALLVVYYIVTPRIDILYARSFEQNAWLTATERRTDERARMASDLLRRHQLTGMTESDVVKLLGKPDPSSDFSRDTVTYWLGPERGGLGLRSQWLVLEMTPARTVRGIRIVIDRQD